ncbi:MAG TPA: PAS domain S-box protein [Anaerolineales bacterium]|nr:PAS domain S-box protein [Anaerolineales bacterium]
MGSLDFSFIGLLGLLVVGGVLLVGYLRQVRGLRAKNLMLSAIPHPFVVVDEVGRIVFVNASASRLIGKMPEQANGRKLGDVFQEFSEGEDEFLGASARELRQISIHVGGEKKWFAMQVTNFRGVTGNAVQKLITFYDISQYKQLENALETSQALYRNVTEQADEGIAIIQGHVIVYANPRLLAMTGYIPNDILRHPYENFIPLEHIQDLRVGFNRRVQGEAQPFVYESVLTRKDGSSFPVELKIGWMTFEGAEAALVMIQDITARKLAERQLRLQSEALAAAANGIVITDLDGRIQWVNPALERMTGYMLEEVVGKNPRVFRSGKQSKEFYKNLWDTIKSGQIWQGELINRRKDGELYDEQLTIAPVKDEQDQITHFVAVKENVTSRKISEQSVRRSERQFRELVMNTPVPMMIYDNDHQLILINWRFMEAFGYASDMIPTIDHWWALAFPEEGVQKRFKRDWEAQFRLGVQDSSGFIPIEGEVVCKNGSKRFVRFSLVRLEDKYIVSLLDQTKQKNAEVQLRQRARHLMLLNEVTLSALRNNDIGDLCQELADQMGSLFEADGCFISLWDPNKKQAMPIAAYGPMRGTYARLAHPEMNEPTLTEAVLLSGHAIAVDDVRNSPYLSKRIAEKFPTHSILALPLIANNFKLGAALISYEKPHFFTPDELERGEQVAAQVALGIAKAKLFQAEEEKHQLALALVEISTLLGASLHVDTLLTRMLDLIHRVVPYDAGSVLVIEEGRTHVLFKRGYDQFGYAVDAFMGAMEMDIAKTPNLRKLVETQRPLIIPDKRTDPNWVWHSPDEVFLSWAGAPIHYNGEVMAILSLEKTEPDFFHPEHSSRLAAFAGQAAVALEIARLFDEVHQLAIVDALTGAFSRRHILELAVQEIERSRRYAHSLCIFMLDIDHFKQVNDTYGHLVGDLVLQKVIQWSRETVRRTDRIGRYGGEEFIVMLPETEIIHAMQIAERLRERIEQTPLKMKDEEVFVTVSIGVSYLRIRLDESPEDLLKELLEQADQALYVAKASGRNRVVQYARS